LANAINEIATLRESVGEKLAEVMVDENKKASTRKLSRPSWLTEWRQLAEA
jgi:hypothetical protein